MVVLSQGGGGMMVLLRIARAVAAGPRIGGGAWMGAPAGASALSGGEGKGEGGDDDAGPTLERDAASPFALRGGAADEATTTATSKAADGDDGVTIDVIEDKAERKARVVARNAPQSVKKLQRVADLVRGMALDEALIQTRLMTLKAARTYESLLQNARAVAVNHHGLDEKDLIVEETWVVKGQHGPKQARIHGRGRAGTMRTERSHVHVVASASPDAQSRRFMVRMPDPRQRRILHLLKGKGAKWSWQLPDADATSLSES